MKTKLSLIVIVAASLAASESFSEDYHWKDAVSGTFGDSTKWSPEGVPGTDAADTANFVFYNKRGDILVNDSSASGIRTFSAFNYGENSANRQSWLNTTFDLGGNTWSVNGAWTLYTLGTFNNFTYNPEIVFKNGTINVIGNMLLPRSGIEYGGRISLVGPLNVAAGNLGVGGGGTTVVISNGAKIVTGMAAFSDGSSPLYLCNGDHVKVLLEGSGTELQCEQLLANQRGISGCLGGNEVSVTNGACVKVSDVIRIGGGDSAGSSVSNRICVLSGGTTEVVRAWVSYGLRVGVTGSSNEFVVRGRSARVYLENARWYVGDNALASDNAVRIADGGLMEVCAKSDNVDAYFGASSDNRLVIENGGRLECTSYNKKQNNFIFGKSATASRHSLTISGGAYMGVSGNPSVNTDHRMTTYIGIVSGGTSGGVDCSMTVSNAVYNGWSTDCNLFIGGRESDQRAKLRIEGDEAKVSAFACYLGCNVRLELVPGPNGFNDIPLRLGKCIYWYGTAALDAGNAPKLVVDVANWNPAERKCDIELVRAAGELSSYNMNVEAIQTIVDNAEILNARDNEEWKVYATDDLKHIRLSFRRKMGLSVIVR